MPPRRRTPRPRLGRPPLGAAKLQLLGVRLRREVKTRIEERARAENRSASDWSAAALERALDTPTEPTTEAQIDAMANDGRLTRLAMQLAIDAGADWPSLDGEAQDAWHERAIDHLRGVEPTTDYDKRRANRSKGRAEPTT